MLKKSLKKKFIGLSVAKKSNNYLQAPIKPYSEEHRNGRLKRVKKAMRGLMENYMNLRRSAALRKPKKKLSREPLHHLTVVNTRRAAIDF